MIKVNVIKIHWILESDVPFDLIKSTFQVVEMMIAMVFRLLLLEG